MSLPIATGSGESVLVIERSAIGTTVVVAVAELLLELGSAVSLVTVAVFDTVPAAVAVTLITMLALVLLFSVPSAQVTVLLAALKLHVP